MNNELIFQIEIKDNEVIIKGFSRGVSMSHLKIPKRISGLVVRSIAPRAFEDEGIEQLKLPYGLREIGAHAFQYNKLSSICIPNSVRQIEAYAFRQNNFVRIELGDGIEEIGASAFELCNFPGGQIIDEGINHLELPSSLKMVGENAFRHQNIESLTIKCATASFEYNPFMGNSLRKVNGKCVDKFLTLDEGKLLLAYFGDPKLLRIPEGVERIAGGFINKPWVKIKSLLLPESLLEIGPFAFSGRGIGEVSFPGYLKRIRKCAFSVNKFTRLIFPNSIEEIGQKAFGHNDSLDYIELPKKKLNIHSSAFDGTEWNKSYINIPQNKYRDVRGTKVYWRPMLWKEK